MDESEGIPESAEIGFTVDAGWRPAGMAKPYSDDLRERVVLCVEEDVRATKRLANSPSA